MEAAVGLFDANRLEVGQMVSLTTEDLPETFTGHIRRINSILDTTSLTVKVFIHLQDPQLREGMYMVGKTEGRPIANAVAVSKDLLVNNNRLFAVDNSVLVLKPVRVVAERGDMAIVRGLENGTRILGEVWPEAREGLAFPQTPQTPTNGSNPDSPQPPPAG
jgi:multidrug efflux pump subunit AcrA (membrane-fusion protein)